MHSTKQYRAQLESAYTLLAEDTTSLEKFEKIKTLLLGINPKLDERLNQAGTTLSHLQSALKADVIHLTGHALPELTPVDKKRKKLLLAFLASWKSLKGEVKRVQGYSGTGTEVVKTVAFAKGPFGLITAVAVVIVGVGLLLRQSITTVNIENVGCPPIIVPTELPFPIPGLRLPSSPIISGAPASASLPALPITVSATSSAISATILGQTGSYTLPPRVASVSFDGISLLSTSTALDLSGRSHSLLIECR